MHLRTYARKKRRMRTRARSLNTHTHTHTIVLNKGVCVCTFDKWLEDNKIERHSTYNEGKAVVIERFNRTLKGRMWRYFSAKNTNVQR